MNDVKYLADNPHSVYTRNAYFWRFLMDSYEGGQDYCQGQVNNVSNAGVQVYVGGKGLNSLSNTNLFKHKKEREEDYKERIKMSYYYNFCAPIIDIYTNHLFKEPILLDTKGVSDAALKVRMDNIDRMGSSLVEFRKQIAEFAQVYGHCFIVCDKPTASDRPIITLRDKMDAGMFPYFTLYRPENILNWALDEFGNPYWVLIKESLDTNNNPFDYNADTSKMCRYRLWTTTEWIVYDNEYKEVSRGTHTSGCVPIVCVFDKKSKKERNFLGISAIADISFISRDIYNACSELREILRNQTFAFLALQGTSDEYSDITVGTSKGLLYPETRNKPEYVSPPPANAEVMFSHIDRQVHKIFQLAKLEGGTASATTESAGVQSGVSKAWDFNETNSTLSMKAGNIEDAETRMWQIFARQDGSEFVGYVNYPTEFSIKDLNADIDEAEKLMRINLGTEFNKEIKRTIIKKKFPRIPDIDLNKMVADMEKTQDKEANGSVMSRFSFLNKNANSSGKNGGKDVGRTEKE